MERRVVIAVVLAIGVLFLTPRLFPPAARSKPAVDVIHDTASAQPSQSTPQRPRREEAAIEARPGVDTTNATERLERERLAVGTPRMVHVFENFGAALEHVELREYRALNQDTGFVALDSDSDPLLTYSLVVPNDTLVFGLVPFVTKGDSARGVVVYEGRVDGWIASIRYALDSTGYLMRVSGELVDTTGRPAGDSAFLVVHLPRALRSYEANVVEDQRGIAVAFKPAARGASQFGLGSLDPNERRVETGPLSWVALKSKYFILGVLVADSTSQLTELQVRGLPRTDGDMPNAEISIVQRVQNGRFAFDVYAGPQKWDVMQVIGRDFGSANSYGGWLQPVVQPFATIVMRVLLWMRQALALPYGWVLLLFGVLVRIAMWPLNQVAMRSSMRMQELQPLLSEVQKRYKSEPQRMSAETMRLYKEHGMSPFSPLAGCFPILLSMPVLFALFFVFQSTIEFRGVPFLWLDDISLKDPLYIAPLLMGGSMFVTSWITMRSSPPNPQTKVMTYVLPVMMTVLLANMASGLNLYWTAQNIASLPQQWLIVREREKARKKKAG